MDAQHTVTVDDPIDAVFDFLADGLNNPRWREGVIEIEKSTGDGGVGTEYRQMLRGPGGRAIAGDYRVTTHDRPTTLGFDVIAGPARPTGRFDLSEAAGGTRITFRLELEPRGPARLLARMIRAQIQREVRSLDALARALDRD